MIESPDSPGGTAGGASASGGTTDGCPPDGGVATDPARRALRSLAATLRESPAAIPALVAIAVLIVWAGSQGGYPLTHWAPGAVVVLVLLLIALGVVPLRLSEIPRAVRLAALCLALYTVLGYLSILWAAVPADAWEGANRTLLYLLVFVLFAAWPGRPRAAALILVLWTVAMIGLGVFCVVHLLGGSSLASSFYEGRLVYPTGYANANAAQWMIAFWPALLLARSSRLPWGLRGLLAGGAVLLAALALLSQSRGSFYATPVMLVLVFGLLPDRVATLAILAPIAVALAALAPGVLHVHDRIVAGATVGSAMHRTGPAILLAALLVGLLVSAVSARLAKRPPSPALTVRVQRAIGTGGVVLVVAVVVAGLVAAGNPIRRIEHGWDTFKGGYAADSSTGSRLVSGLGSNRYDFYRVGLDEFLAHPILGTGVDNFAEQYLRHGRSTETPHYPHSVELRTLSETGLVGALLAVVGLGAALIAGGRAIRPSIRPGADRRAARRPGESEILSDPPSDPLARVLAAAALGGFAYWVVHGSFDWFWEFAGLGAPAFAMLGLACSLAPGRGGTTPPSGPAPPISRAPVQGRLRLALVGLASVLAAASLIAPWLSELQAQRAARIWTENPRLAYTRLRSAARLNPLSDEPDLLAGSIALRLGELPRADRYFAQALERVPGDAYAALERGAIASARGNRTEALGLLERAVYLNPRDPITREALQTVRSGRRVDLDRLNRAILAIAQQLA